MSSASPSNRFPAPLDEGGEPSGWPYAAQTPLTPLLGRESAVEHVRALLDDDTTRLVTLTGPGGIGKTRLAAEVTSRMASEFANGAHFISLAGTRDPEHVASVVANALEVSELRHHTIAESLSAALGRQHLLLVLDNMEQVVGAAPWLADLLEACPRIKALVTSRIVLRVRGEHVYPVPPLHVPSAEREQSMEVLRQCESIALFVQRARAVQPGFDLTAANAETVREICQRVDGVPLAIELAAARVNALTPAEILARLTRRLTLLASGMRDRPLRHQAMRDTISWSHDLLDPAEQTVFRRLSIFRGSFTVEATEAVVQPDDDGNAEARVPETSASALDLVASLLDQSLLQRASAHSSEVAAFRMLDTIREYGFDQLVNSGEHDLVANSHAKWVLRRAELAAPQLTGAEQVFWLNHLGTMHDDIRAAWEWLFRSEQHERALRLVTALWPYAYTRGYYTTTRKWLDIVLEANKTPSTMRVEALNAAGVLASIQGEPAIALARHTEARELSVSLGDKHGTALALNGLGIVAEEVEDDPQVAYRWYEQARQLYQEIGDTRGIAVMLTNLGNLLWKDGSLRQAVEFHTRAGKLFRESSGPRGVAWAATNLGSIAIEQGNLADAVERLSEALDLYRELGDWSGIIETLERFADIAGARGQQERQVGLLGAASGMRESVNMPVWASEREEYDAMLVALRERLGNVFDAVWSSGRRMTLDEVFQMALEDAAEPATEELATETKPGTPAHGLSRRETEVLILMAEGMTNKEIADSLFISPRTVTSHTTNILGKLGVATRTNAVAYAIRHGIA